MPEPTLAELITRTGERDEQVWAAVVRGHTAGLVRLARRFRFGDADAADICQDVWLALVRRADAVRDPRRLAGWLATTARRRAARTAALRGTEARRVAALPPPEPNWACQPEAWVLAEERDRALWAAVAALPPRHRMLVELLAERPWLSYAALAAELGIKESSVGPLRSRCFERLRRRLLADGFGPGDFR